MSSRATLFRLLRRTKPYRVRLGIGIIAGALTGGALFGVLTAVPGIIGNLEAQQMVPVPANDGAETKDADDNSNRDRLLALADRLNIPVQTADGGMTWQLVVLSTSGLFLFFLLRSIATYINRYCIRWAGLSIVRDLRDDIYGNLHLQSLQFYGRRDVGRLISRVMNDTQEVNAVTSNVLADLSRAPFEIIATLAFVIRFSTDKGLVVLPVIMFLFLPFAIVPIIILGRRIRTHARNSMNRISVLASRMHETITGIRLVKASNMETAEMERFKAANRGFFRELTKILRAEILMRPLMEVVSTFSICMFLAYCFKKGIKLDEIVPMCMAGFMVYQPLRRLAKINAMVQRGIAASERSFELLDLRTALPEAPDPVTITSFTDKLIFDHVSFRYDDDSPVVIDDLSLTIPCGSIVALVGETGSGKSTVANLAARFLDPTQGTVTIDGTDLRSVETTSLRKLVGVVTQDVILFNESIADNISYGTGVSDRDKIVEAATLANAHEFISAEADGYDRVVGEKGFRLSGGQRQRIAIARTLLRNPKILILDEATSALDTVTEKAVQAALDNLMENRTALVIAHRINTVRNADVIIVVDQGRIAESGTYDELMDKKGAFFRLANI